MKPWLTGLILMMLLSAAAFGFWLRSELGSAYRGFDGPESFVEISRGSGTQAIAASLKARGVLRYELPFILYVRWAGLGRRLQAGEYCFTLPARPVEIAQRLADGDIFYRSVTVPEGLTANETISLLAKGGFGNLREMEALVARTDWISDLDKDATSLEGYLFPETYRFSRRSNSEEILKAMVSQFRRQISALLEIAPLPEGWTLPRIVILASLIEKEAKTQEERRLVASVLVNRLRKRMHLGCDPTIIYALKLAGTYNGNLRKVDLSLDSPYNSYLKLGLPPGPIANPGSKSLHAALAPATSDYLYYVSRNDGTHVFSRDLRSHQIAVSRYQKRGR